MKENVKAETGKVMEYQLQRFDGGWDLVGVADGLNVMTGATFFDGPLALLVVRLLSGEEEVRGMAQEEAEAMLERMADLSAELVLCQDSFVRTGVDAMNAEYDGLRQAALIMMCQDRPAPGRMSEDEAKVMVSELVSAAVGCALSTLPEASSSWKALEGRQSRLIGQVVEAISGRGSADVTE